MDIVTPLGGAGIRCAVAVGPGDPARYSRHVDDVIEPLDPWTESDAYVRRLLDWAAQQQVPPVLLYPTDGDLVMVSRHRAELRTGFRFTIPTEGLVADLTDKERFRVLAERLQLPTPRSEFLPSGADPAGSELSFPVIVKPAVHHNSKQLLSGKAKAMRADSAKELQRMWHKAGESGIDCIAQELIPGPETAIESYHAYIDDSGETVAEFTGKKIRTIPAEYGESTALSITDRRDVLDVGRLVATRLGLTGVMKIDFKRDPDGALWLLEVNPRFNLWHRPGAAAGANLPVLYYADMAGEPRPRTGRVRAGVTWCDLRGDLHATRSAGLPVHTWLRFAAGATTLSTGDWSDPLPLLRGIVLPAVRNRLPSRNGR